MQYQSQWNYELNVWTQSNELATRNAEGVIIRIYCNPKKSYNFMDYNPIKYYNFLDYEKYLYLCIMF